MERALNYIDGQWVESASGRWRATEDPSTGETFAEVPDGDREDAERAVAAARRAFDEGPWPRLHPAERRRYLLRLGEVLSARSAELGDLIIRDAGCPARVSELMQVATPIGHLEDFAEHALLLRTSTAFPIQEEPFLGQSEVRREPIGVCVGFAPYNFPLFMNIWKLAPAVAMGNTVVLKPSPLSPLAASELARACDEVGFPAGVVNVVHGDVEPGDALVRHPGVNKISFTGSTAVGRKVMEGAAGTIKRLTLELGGKSANIILDDADLELAVRGSIFGAYVHAGQGCVCGTRLLVPSARYDEIVDLLRDRVAAMVVGSAHDYDTDLGPLISAAQLDKVERYVASALDEGAKVLIGGRRPRGFDRGYYYEPTVLVDVRNGMKVACEEIFGPVLSVIRYETDAEALRIANDSIYGLGAIVWSGDLRRAREMARGLQAGTVWINDFGAVSPNGPFGGYKQSGLGRELNVDGAYEYTELKHIYTALDQDLDRRGYSLVGGNWD